jgi:cytidine deaminase
MLARLAISRIWDERVKIHESGNVKDQGILQPATNPSEGVSNQMVPAAGTAYILDSLKNPDEARLLREIYGDGFLLISAYAPRDDRQSALAIRLGGPQAEGSVNTNAAELIEIDHSEEEAGEFGQRVSDVFALADLVVDTREHRECESALRRFLQTFFNYPFHSPSQDEFGMFLAKCSALRSLDMSRQVGAAILDVNGSVLGQGHNDIPKFGGGLYWEGDTSDGRDYSIGKDYSVVYRNQIVEEIVHGLAEHDILSRDWQEDPNKLIEYLSRGEGKSIWSHFIVSNLLEFGRSLHAEMAAILDSSRKGVSVVGGTLYCTTFPCHLCARMIIGAGIHRVVYMEPYHKSKTEVMYRDSVVVDPPSDVPGKVNFTPFVGIAPEKFEKLFRWRGKRRDRDGTPSQWEPERYGTRIKRYINNYIYLEAITVESVEHILKARGLAWTPEKEEVEDGEKEEGKQQ